MESIAGLGRISGRRRWAGWLGLAVFAFICGLVVSPLAAHADNAPPSSAPANVKAVRSGGTLIVSWDAVAGATAYNVNWTNDHKSSWHRGASDVSGTSVTLENIEEGKAYYVAVQAANANGVGGWRDSQVVEAVPPTPTPEPEPTPTPAPTATPAPVQKPPAGPPASVSATRRDGTLTVSWNAVAGASGYNVNWTSDHKASWSRGASGVSGTSVTLTGMDDSKAYYVSVQAENAGGVSGWRDSSLIAVAPTPAPEPTATPTSPEANATPTATPPAALSFNDAAIADQTYTKDTAFTTLTLPAATGGSGSITYSLSPALPAGLTFDANARTISGTPTESQASAAYYYSATDGTDTAMLQFELAEAVAEPVETQAGAASLPNPPNQNWQKGVAVNVTLPTAAGYTAHVLTGMDSATLPAGITWNATTRVLSGTPTEVYSAEAFRYKTYKGGNPQTDGYFIIRVKDTDGNHAPDRATNGHVILLRTQQNLNIKLNCNASGDYGGLALGRQRVTDEYFHDVDSGDSVTVTVSSANSAMVSAGMTTKGGVEYVLATFKHPPSSYVTLTVTGTDTKSLTETIAWQVKGDACTRALSIDENSAAATVVGNAAANTGGSKFTMTGTAATYFDIDATSGQITVKSGTTLDYETTTSYSGSLAYEVGGAAASLGLTINVNDIKAPAPGAPTLAVNSTNPTTALDVSWTAPTPPSGTTINDYDVQYRAAGTSAWTEWNATDTSTATSATITGLTAGTEYEVQVRASITGEGNGGWSVSSFTRHVAENSGENTDVGAKFNVKATDFWPMTFTLGGTDASKFKMDNDTGYKTDQSGQIEVKSGTSLDFESKSSYGVTLRIVEYNTIKNLQDYTHNVLIIVTDVNEPPGTPAAPTVTANSTTPTTKLDVSWTAPTMTGKPAITDYDVQYRKVGDSTWVSHSHTGTATTAALTGLTSGKTYEVQVRATNDEGTSGWSDSGTAITQAGGVTRSIDENSAAGANVGTAVTATANSKYTYTHSLSGTDASKFTIESSSGQIKVKTGTNLDYETTTSYSVTVTVAVAAKTQGVQSQSVNPNAPGDYVIPVTINVTDVNEKPAFAATPTRSIAENSAAGTNVGTAVAATDPEGDTLAYTLTGTDAAKFDIGASTGQITVKSGNIPDYEAKSSYSVTVKVSDGKKADGTADTSVDDTVYIKINVTDVNEPPVKLSAPTVAVNATPTTKLDVSWTAPTTTAMAGKPAVNDYDVQYRLSGGNTWASHSFSGTGTSTTLTGLTAGKSYDVQVRAVNDEGNGPWSDSGTAKTQAGGVTRSIAENSPAGTNVGAAVTTTANPNNYSLKHELGGTDASKFTLHEPTGQIKVKTGTSLDYETKSSYNVTVTVKAVAAQVQGAGKSSLSPNAPGNYVVPVTINVTDVNEKPVFSATPTRSIAENSAAGTNVGAAVTATDEEDDTLTYSLTGTDAAKFDIDSGTGQITVKTGHVPDYEAKTSHSVTVNVTDGKAADGTADTAVDATVAITINVTDVAEPPGKPRNLTVTPNTSTPENRLEVSWDAPDMTGKPALSGYDVQYRLAGASNWTAQSHSGTGTSATLSGLTAGKTYQVQVRAKNDEGASGWASGQSITDGSAVTRSVAENSPAGTNVGAAVTAASNPNNYTLTHSLSGTDAGSFTIEEGSGQIKVKSGTNLDYETKTAYSVIVTVKAAQAQTQGAQKQSLNPNAPGDYVVPVTINVTDVNEKPAFSAKPTRSVDENAAAGAKVGAAVAATDPESDTLTYSLTGTDAGKFQIGSGTGQITVKSGTNLDYEAKTSYSVTVNVTDGKKADGMADTSIDDTVAITINVNDVKEPPAKPAAPKVAQNAATPKTKLDVSWTAPDMTGKPAITDYDVQYKKKADSAWTSHSFTGTGASTTLSGLEGGTTYQVQVKAINDEGESDWSDSGTGTTQSTNLPPTFPDIPNGGTSLSRSIAENSPVGSKVGAPVKATDTENDTLYYELDGADATKFDIGETTGQITVKDGNIPNFEARSSYSVKVSVSDRKDGDGNPDTAIDDSVAVTITVTDVDEPPATPDAPTLSENAGDPQGSLDVSWTAPDMTGKPPVTDYDVRYRAVGAPAWRLRSHTGTGTSTTLTGLTTNTSYEVQVKAKNDEGESGWSTPGQGRTDIKREKLLDPMPTPTPSLDPSPPRVPGPTLGTSACATSYDFGGVMHVDRHDGGADLDIAIGSMSTDGKQIMVAGFIRDGDLGQTYSVVRYEADGRVVRVWVDPDDPLIREIPWAEVNAKYTVPVCVIVSIPLDDRYPAEGQLVRQFDGPDDRIFRHVGSGEWRHIPDIGTFQSMGLLWCNVTAADTQFFTRIKIGEPLPSSGEQPRADYPNCWVWGEGPRSR